MSREKTKLDNNQESNDNKDEQELKTNSNNLGTGK